MKTAIAAPADDNDLKRQLIAALRCPVRRFKAIMTLMVLGKMVTG